METQEETIHTLRGEAALALAVVINSLGVVLMLYSGAGISRIKIIFDLSCLAVTMALTLIFLGHLDGLGIGTILAACTMGKVIGLIGKQMDKHFAFVSILNH